MFRLSTVLEVIVGRQPMGREHWGPRTNMRKGSHSEDNFHKCPITIIMRICYEHSYSEFTCRRVSFLPRFRERAGKSEVGCGVM